MSVPSLFGYKIWRAGFVLSIEPEAQTAEMVGQRLVGDVDLWLPTTGKSSMMGKFAQML